MIKQTKSKIVYQNKWMHVKEDVTELPDGSAGLYGYVVKPDFAAILPVHSDGRIQLVEQYRYPVRRRMWEIPQGGAEHSDAQGTADAAARELREETGFVAATWVHMARLHEAPALVDQACDLFLATDLSAGKITLDQTEQDMQTAAFTLDEIKAMITSGDITCAITISAIGLWVMR